MGRQVINVGHGDPTIFRNWWKEHNILPEIRTDSLYLYEYQEGENTELITTTHKFHQLFGTDCPTSSIVYGNGSSQVMNAILYAISKELGRKILVGYLPPVYMLMHEFLTHSQLVEITFDLTRSDIDVEIVIDPNNPSGERRDNISTAKYVIFDRAYNWPIYTAETTQTSEEKNHITVYTISKALGMGGLRLGWAFINDDSLTVEVKRALFVMGICPNSFGMVAANRVMQSFLSDRNLLYTYCVTLEKQIRERFTLLRSCPQFIVTNQAGPYSWIKSHDGSDIAQTLLDEYQIQVYSGALFASSPEYARLSVICSEEDFSIIICRLLLK